MIPVLTRAIRRSPDLRDVCKVDPALSYVGVYGDKLDMQGNLQAIRSFRPTIIATLLLQGVLATGVTDG
jgi:hypothetical protein